MEMVTARLVEMETVTATATATAKLVEMGMESNRPRKLNNT
jgi:hypothetical protein